MLGATLGVLVCAIVDDLHFFDGDKAFLNHGIQVGNELSDAFRFVDNFDEHGEVFGEV